MAKQSIRTFVFICLLAVSTANLLGQQLPNQGLVLTGALASVTPVLNESVVVTKLPDQPSQRNLVVRRPVFAYRVRLYLQLRNDSRNPLLLLDPKKEEIQRRIEFLDQVFVDPKSEFGVVKAGTWLAPYLLRARDVAPHYDWLGAFAKRLDMPQPVNHILKIDPDGYHEFVEEIVVEDGFTLPVKSGQSLQEATQNAPIPEYPSLRIKFHFSNGKQHRDRSLLRTLQERWKPYGHLVLDGNGDFTITSNAIVMAIGG